MGVAQKKAVAASVLISSVFVFLVRKNLPTSASEVDIEKYNIYTATVTSV